MLYVSTRSKAFKVTASEAILAGLAPDGGLFVPETLPSVDFSSWCEDSYEGLAERLFSLFLSDYSPQAIRKILEKSYGGNFDDPRIAPVHRLDEETAVLELWHGPTLAFKDLALQCLPQLFTEARRIQGVRDRFLILTATSGDTGKAAMTGFSGVEDSWVAVFYPHEGVSALQERQMLTNKEANVRAFALEGTFDDCQRQVKDLMQDQGFGKGLADRSIRLTSANSINIGRLIPQMVYYIYAYFRTVENYGDPLSVIVPSGNAGNILAARYVKGMGLPLDRIHLASNSNKVLFDFLTTGVCDRRRELLKTSSPSMDILVASNLERYLHLLTGEGKTIGRLMEGLKKEGLFQFDPARLDLDTSWSDEGQVYSTIRTVYEDFGYLIDPHTAVAARGAFCQTSGLPRLIVSTASPYKFIPSVLAALGQDCPPGMEEQILHMQGLLGGPLPESIGEMMASQPQERLRLSAPQMEAAILALIGEKDEGI